jgi:hypothetical protein
MAARYVNPENVAAQGQSFYTGLHPVEYQSGSGAGGKNAFGAGSGGSAGVSADRSGADAGRAWQYPGIKFDFGGGDKDGDGRGGSGSGVTINNQNINQQSQSQQQQQQQNAFGGGFGGGFSPPDEGPIDVPSWREPDAPEPMGELEPGKPMGELEPPPEVPALEAPPRMKELGPGTATPSGPSQDPVNIARRKRTADQKANEIIIGEVGVGGNVTGHSQTYRPSGRAAKARRNKSGQMVVGGTRNTSRTNLNVFGG